MNPHEEARVNFPTSDIQFLATMLKKIRAGDQITSAESARLDQIEKDGFSAETVKIMGERPMESAPRGQI